MNKKNKILIIIIVIFLIGFVFERINTNKSNVYEKQNVSSIKKDKELLSMNLEQTAGAGDYKTVTQSGWPTEGYKFNAELSRCENGSELSWDDTKKAVIVSGNTSDKCYVYFDIYQPTQPTLTEYIKSQYTGTQGENSLYYHNSTLTNSAGDNSYRYAGASDSVNNYICLGSDEATCSEANLFRIIGVFGDKTKVIRAKSVENKQWHSSESNTWSSSSLNTYLNGEYLTSLGTLADKIATTTWKVGGGSSTYLFDVPKTAYQYEVGSSASSTTYGAKIGLMYMSDYGFAVSPSAWSTALGNYANVRAKNWLYLGSTEWTISRNSGLPDYAFYVYSSGYVTHNVVTLSFAVRPSFNLESSITYISGDGTIEKPIRIN